MGIENILSLIIISAIPILIIVASVKFVKEAKNKKLRVLILALLN